METLQQNHSSLRSLVGPPGGCPSRYDDPRYAANQNDSGPWSSNRTFSNSLASLEARS